MDWYRYQRALAAGHVEAVEERRRLHASNKLKTKDLKQADWTAIKQHDELLFEHIEAREAAIARRPLSIQLEMDWQRYLFKMQNGESE